jgi:hypothetical protein
MNKQHERSINDNTFVPEEGQRGLLCSNKESIRCPSLGKLSEEDRQAFKILLKDLAKIFINKE